MRVSAQAPGRPAAEQASDRPAGQASIGAPSDAGPDVAPEPGPPSRPLAVTGTIAACAAAGTGLAALTTLTAIGWVAAPHAGLGSGLGGVVRTAATLWLAAHHVGFDLRGVGPIGMLPLGLVLLPGALLWWAGRWVVRTGQVTRLRHVGYGALALAVPYALLSGALAVASRTAQVVPSLSQAVAAGFLVALAAGGLGGARTVAPWARLGGLLPARPRSVVMGTLGCLGVLIGTGAVLAGGSLAAHLGQFRALTDELSPGGVGAALLLLADFGYLPNAVIWGIAYSLGPGFAFGVGTVVAPTGSALGPVPVFPMLAALPSGPRAAVPVWLTVAVLAAPYLAATVGGVVTVRIAPTPTLEAAPLWGFASGGLAGCVVAVLSAFSGGPLGAGRLSAVGPSAWQVGVVAVLALGVTGALAGGVANWWLLRGRGRAGLLWRWRREAVASGSLLAPGQASDQQQPPASVQSFLPRPPSPGLPSVVDETDDAGGHRRYLDPWAGAGEEDETWPPPDDQPRWERGADHAQQDEDDADTPDTDGFGA